MPACPHDAPRPRRVCAHLLEREQAYRERFTGRGIESELTCRGCEVADVEVCAACLAAALEGDLLETIGAPAAVDAPSSLRFEHARVPAHTPRFLDVQPVVGADRARWIGFGDDGRLHRWDLDDRTTTPISGLIEVVDVALPVRFRISRDGRLAAVANKRAVRGAVVDLETGAVVLPLARDDYHAEHCDFSMAFVERDGRTLLVHAPDWNRLDVVDARTGELLTARGPTSYTRDEERPAHYLDYFHCAITVSPGQQFIADSGWVWAPVGIVATWSLERWLGDHVWESEDGQSRHGLTQSGYHWDYPLCWLDDTRLAIWGYGEDNLVPAAQIFDVTTGARLRWFGGPRGMLAFDRYLVSFGDVEGGAAVWDVDHGTCLARDDARFTYYHPDAKVFVKLDDGGDVIVSRLCGHDAGAAWTTPAVRAVAAAIREAGELSILGDALEVAGCDDDALLAHCRAPGPHAHGMQCWVLDRLRR